MKFARIETIKRFNDLPPFPTVAMKVMQSVARSDVSMIELSSLISGDPAFAAEVMTIVNSPLCGFRKEIFGILQATTLLGLERLKGIAVTAGMRAYTRGWEEVSSLRACWRHSLACALIAEELSTATFADRDISYTMGILHDLGRVALVAAWPKAYTQFLDDCESRPCNVEVAEREIFGIDHCEAGALLVQSWHLPGSFLPVVAHHHDRLAHTESPSARMLKLACSMADCAGFSAASRAQQPAFEDLCNHLSERDRQRFKPQLHDLTLRVAAKINAIES